MVEYPLSPCTDMTARAPDNIKTTQNVNITLTSAPVRHFWQQRIWATRLCGEIIKIVSLFLCNKKRGTFFSLNIDKNSAFLWPRNYHISNGTFSFEHEGRYQTMINYDIWSIWALNECELMLKKLQSPGIILDPLTLRHFVAQTTKSFLHKNCEHCSSVSIVSIVTIVNIVKRIA